jgi:hypothetical protein
MVGIRHAVKHTHAMTHIVGAVHAENSVISSAGSTLALSCEACALSPRPCTQHDQLMTLKLDSRSCQSTMGAACMLAEAVTLFPASTCRATHAASLPP